MSRKKKQKEVAVDPAEVAAVQLKLLNGLKDMAAKLLPLESSPFDPSGREWRRGERALKLLHGEYEFSLSVSNEQRTWWYEGALRFVQEHARLYAKYFEGELITL